MADTLDHPASTTGESPSLQDIFSKSQKEFFDNWAKATATFQETLGGSATPQSATENSRQVFELYDSWKQSSREYLDTMMSSFGDQTGAHTFTKVFRAGDAYMKLYEFWEPLSRALQQRALDPATYKDQVDPDRYAETISQIFGFGTPKVMAEMAGETSNLIETWAGKAQAFVEPWSEAMRRTADASLKLASGDPDAGMSIFRSFHSAFQDTFGKALSMPAVGKDREYLELLSGTAERYTEFLATNAELQRQMHVIAQHAMDKVVETLAEKVRAGEEIGGFEDFVKLWSTTNEEAFLEFFETEQFSQLQGIVLNTAVESRKQFQKLMEVCLKDYPIALRSEMDDVCRANYQLNKSVRALKKKDSQIDAMRQELNDLRKKSAQIDALQQEVNDLRKKNSPMDAMRQELNDLKKGFADLGNKLAETTAEVERAAKKGSTNKAAGKKGR